MRLLALFLTVAAVTLTSSSAWAATVSVSARVTELEELQSTRLRIVVSGEQRVNPPRFPEIDGLDVRYSERSTRMEQSPSGIVRTVTFVYRVSPTRPGTFVVPSVDLTMPNGEILSTEPISITAKPSGSTPLPDEPLVAEADFDRSSAWEGEVVRYHTKVTARTRVGTVNWRLPPFKGLTRPANGDLLDATTVIGDPRGDITIIERTFPFIASGIGNRTQPPAVAQVDVVVTSGRSIFGNRRRRTSVPVGGQAKLQVRPLPTAPPEFSGLVGDFELQSRLTKSRAVVGETVPWSLMISGEGVVDGFLLDDLETPGARVYRGDTEVSGRLFEDGYRSSKIFRLNLVPTEPGTLVIPPVEVVVFSPTKGEFVTLTADVGELQVTGEALDDEMKSFTADTEITAPEPVEIVDVYTWGLADTPPLAPLLPVLLGLISFPAGLLLFGEGAGALRSAWATRRRSRRVEVRGAARLKSLPAEGPERLATLDLALREALADHLKMDVGSLRRAEALAALHEDLHDRVANAFAALDRCRFAGGTPNEDLLVAVRDAIGRLG